MGITTSRRENSGSSINGTGGDNAAPGFCLTHQDSPVSNCSVCQQYQLQLQEVGTSYHASWTRKSSETLITWKYGAVLWGFEPRIDYTSNVKGRLQPWCTSGRHFTIRHDPPNKILQRPFCLLTIIESTLKQDTHIRLPYAYASRLHVEPEPAGHYLKSAQV